MNPQPNKKLTTKQIVILISVCVLFVFFYYLAGDNQQKSGNCKETTHVITTIVRDGNRVTGVQKENVVGLDCGDGVFIPKPDPE